MGLGDWFLISFCFFKKACKASGLQLKCNTLSIVVNLAVNKKTAWNYRRLIQRYAQLWYFSKGSRSSFSTTFYLWFLKKNVSCAIFYRLNKFHFLIAFTSWDIDQCMYCNCLLTRLWRNKLWNWPYFSN